MISSTKLFIKAAVLATAALTAAARLEPRYVGLTGGDCCSSAEIPDLNAPKPFISGLPSAFTEDGSHTRYVAGLVNFNDMDAGAVNDGFYGMSVNNVFVSSYDAAYDYRWSRVYTTDPNFDDAPPEIGGIVHIGARSYVCGAFAGKGIRQVAKNNTRGNFPTAVFGAGAHTRNAVLISLDDTGGDEQSQSLNDTYFIVEGEGDEVFTDIVSDGTTVWLCGTTTSNQVTVGADTFTTTGGATFVLGFDIAGAQLNSNFGFKTAPFSSVPPRLLTAGGHVLLASTDNGGTHIRAFNSGDGQLDVAFNGSASVALGSPVRRLVTDDGTLVYAVCEDEGTVTVVEYNAMSGSKVGRSTLPGAAFIDTVESELPMSGVFATFTAGKLYVCAQALGAYSVTIVDPDDPDLDALRTFESDELLRGMAGAGGSIDIVGLLKRPLYLEEFGFLRKLDLAGAPLLLSIAPDSTVAGNAAFTLKLTGTDFAADSIVSFAGNPLTPTSITATEIQVSVPADLVAHAGSAAVEVLSFVTTGGAAHFTIEPLTSFRLRRIAPSSVVTGSGMFTMTLTGAGFDAASVVTWQGLGDLTPTAFTSTTLTVSVPASYVQTSGVARVAVKRGTISTNGKNFVSGLDQAADAPIIQGLSCGIVMDGAGNRYVTGNFTGVADFNLDVGAVDLKSSAGGADVYVTRYNADGSYGWTQVFGGNSDDFSYNLCTANGVVYAVGQFASTNAGIDGGGFTSTTSLSSFVMALDGANGEPLTGFGLNGVQIFNSGVTNSISLGQAVTYSPATGYLYMAGFFSGSGQGIGLTGGTLASRGQFDGYIAALDAVSGAPVASFGAGGVQVFGGAKGDFFYALATTGNALYVGGALSSSDAKLGTGAGLGTVKCTGEDDGVILGLDAFTGKPLSGFGTFPAAGATTFGGSNDLPQHGAEYVYGLALGNGTLYACGRFTSTDAGFGGLGSVEARGVNDAFVIALAADSGQPRAEFGKNGAQIFGGSTDGVEGEVAVKMALTSKALYVTGYFDSDNAQLGEDDSETVSSAGLLDTFVLALNPGNGQPIQSFDTGDITGVQVFGGNGGESTGGIAAYGDDVFITGYSSSTDAGLGGFGPGIDFTGFNGFLLRLHVDGDYADPLTRLDPNQPGVTDDSDGDGYPDVVEIALGTDPYDAASNPSSEMPLAGVGGFEVKNVDVQLLFTSARKDRLRIAGTLKGAADAGAQHLPAYLYFGGEVVQFALNDRSQRDSRFLLGAANGRDGRAVFRIEHQSHELKVNLADEGFARGKGRIAEKPVSVFLLLNGTLYSAQCPVRYHSNSERGWGTYRKK